MSAGTDSSIIYVEDNANIEVNSIHFANNTHNYVYLGEGALFYINSESYEVGDIFQLGSNPTNIITFVQCQQPIILAPAFEKFFINDLIIYWVVNGNSVIIQKKEGDNWIDLYQEVGESKGTYVPKEEGYYRGMSEYGPSDIVYFKSNIENILYNLKGQRILNPEANIPYIRNGKKYIIIN